MTRLLSWIRVTAGLVYMGVAAALFAFVCLLLMPSRVARIKVCNVFGKVSGRVCLWLASAKVPGDAPKWLDRHFPAIYVSNHTATTDVFLGMWLCPIGTCGTAKKEIVWYPFLGQLYIISGHLLIDRGNRASAVEAMRKVAELVHRHRLGIWMWPEGTRSRDGRLLPFKKGFAHLAIATRLPVVPVVVTNAHRGWGKNTLVIHPSKVGITVLDPIPTDQWSIDTLDEHVAEVRARFVAALPPDQQPVEASGLALQQPEHDQRRDGDAHQ